MINRCADVLIVTKIENLTNYSFLHVVGIKLDDFGLFAGSLLNQAQHLMEPQEPT